ncbi:MAG: toxin-antitoxin system YwqK family antitoxin [Bdellovibrionota bacterium]
MKNILISLACTFLFSVLFSGCAGMKSKEAAAQTPVDAKSRIVPLPLAESCIANFDFKLNQTQRCQGKSKDGVKDGLWCCYDEAANLRMAGYFLKGLKHGRNELIDPSGKVEAINTWDKGFMEGPQEAYYADGTLNLTYELKNGDLHGVLKEYNPDGSLRSEGNYRDGLRHGIYKEWDKNGCLVLEEMHQDEKLVYSKPSPCPLHPK